MVNPVAVNRARPRLQWQLQSSLRGKSQTAYRVLVADNEVDLAQNKGNMWDSGKVFSKSSSVTYSGITLSSYNRLYWKVMIWDEEGNPTPWSNVAFLRMGMLRPSDWQAQWICNTQDAYPDSTLTYPAPFFRKEFVVTNKVKQAVVYISGLGMYEMYVNGSKIGDQVLSPVVTNYDKRTLKNLLYHYDDQSSQRALYNVLDVTEYIRQENNVIGVILGNGWYNQRDRIVEGHMWYGIPKMILQLRIEYTDGTIQTVLSDNSWKTATGPLLHDGIFTGEVYDARLNLGDWSTVNYDDTMWRYALSAEAPIGSMEAQTVPYNKIQEVIIPCLEQVNDTSCLYTLPTTISGWCALTVSGTAGDTVAMRYISDEGLDYGQKDVYILNGSKKESWEPRFTWHAFNKVEVTTKGKVKPEEVGLVAKFVYTDVLPVGSFECSNPLYNRIFNAFKNTMLANLKGIISSDPHRERLAYTGDGQIITPSLLYVYDMRTMLTKFVSDIFDAANKNTGYIPHTAPFGGGGGGPAWGSAGVIIPWNYYCHYGDTTLLSEHYQGMKHWVEYLSTRTGQTAIVTHEEPQGWCLGDWSTPHNIIEIPAPLVNTAYFYHVTRIMGKVARILKRNDDVLFFEALAERIYEDFNKVFYNSSTHHYHNGKQGADAIALAYGLVPQEIYLDVFNAMLGHLEEIDFHFDTGILCTPLLLSVLHENGRTDVACKLLDQRDFPGYGYLADPNNTTLWETWSGQGNAEGCGHCHPMFGSVVAWFYNVLAGIKPDESAPGMQHFLIEPTVDGSLSYCKASYNSIHGLIRSDWRVNSKGELLLNITIPANTSARFIIPQWGENKVYESGKPLNVNTHIGVDALRHNCVELLSGKYRFVVR